MDRVTELLEQAPACVRNCVTHHGCDCREYVMARLPDYEAAVEALEILVRGIDGDNIVHVEHLSAARAALARLRDKVPANA